MPNSVGQVAGERQLTKQGFIYIYISRAEIRKRVPEGDRKRIVWSQKSRNGRDWVKCKC